ncbi:anthranilate synthase component I family protein [Haloarcula salinisoli]|uniref:anthranilate synthase component I family protein n=1 Tax=Haloarcula salinisoli TaxID=2487746 RepID=UPI0039A40A11
MASDMEGEGRIPVELRTSVEDPYLAYQRARNESEGIYYETTGGQSGWGYFGIEPAYWVTQPNGEAGSFERLEKLLSNERLVRGDCDVPYPCGAFGWISYDVARELEDISDTTSDVRRLPRIQFGVYDMLAAWEEPRTGDRTELRLTCCPTVAQDDDPGSVYEAAHDRLLAFVREIYDGSEAIEQVESDGPVTFQTNADKTEYSERIKQVKQYIRDGDTFQANISQRISGPKAVHPARVFSALREVNPAPYSALLEFPGVDLISTSPELLLECDDRKLLTEPIAGTRPRGETEEEEERLEEDLLSDEKEHAEHAMLVDLERNDLGKVSEFGSVDVTDYRRIDRYSEVMHTVSVVEGTRKPDKSIPDAIAAVFPGGTITGAPKPKTMDIIDDVETARRGPYTGSIGIIGFDEQATLNMTIRTLVQRNDTYYLRVGAGIVHDSQPVKEFHETLDKGRALINAINTALDSDIELKVDTES